MINEITCHGSSGQDGNVSATIAVSQTDHPVSGVPVFFLHPCRTSDLLKTVRRQHVENAEHENMVSYLISFLSLCGPKIGLHLRPEYATRAPNLPT